jgi:hypothetical protein
MKIPGPKIHGKIIIPTPEEVKKMELAGSYFHFNERLSMRYGLEITLEEYIELCRYPIKTILKEQHKLFGLIQIKGKEVFVVRQRHKDRKLLTALPFKNLQDEKYNKTKGE